MHRERRFWGKIECVVHKTVTEPVIICETDQAVSDGFSVYRNFP